MSAGDARAVNKKLRRAKAAATQRKEFLIAMMKNENGQAFLYDLLERCHVYQTPFAGEQTNLTNFKLGEQNIGLFLLEQLVSANEAGYLEVLKYGQRRNRDSDAIDAGSPAEPDAPGGNDSDSERGD